jgi:hypothetical protein
MQQAQLLIRIFLGHVFSVHMASVFVVDGTSTLSTALPKWHFNVFVIKIRELYTSVAREMWGLRAYVDSFEVGNIFVNMVSKT